MYRNAHDEWSNTLKKGDTDNKYCIVIPSYKPPKEQFIQLLKRLIIFKIKTIIVDSSPGDVSDELASIVKSLDKTENHLLRLLKIPNLGAGYSLNVGIRECFNEGAEIVSIMDDDTIIYEKFNKEEIIDFFNKNLNRSKDLLVLASEDAIEASRKRDIRAWVETGLTFSRELYEKVQFREEFIMDQIDIEFCYQVVSLGGKIIFYPKAVLSNLPVGREIKNGVPHLPTYRLYTLSRNSLYLSIWERSIVPLGIFYFLPQIRYWSLQSIKAGERLSNILFPIIYGFIDGLKKKLGVTYALDKFSNGRFSNDFNLIK
jgi:glycosyltransferase involved in cell wall biosynthesis